MIGPSTFAFILRHYTVHFLSSGVLIGVSLWHLLTKQEPMPAPVALEGISAPLANLADPLAWLCLIVGIATFAYGWSKASALRKGR